MLPGSYLILAIFGSCNLLSGFFNLLLFVVLYLLIFITLVLILVFTSTTIFTSITLVTLCVSRIDLLINRYLVETIFAVPNTNTNTNTNEQYEIFF